MGKLNFGDTHYQLAKSRLGQVSVKISHFSNTYRQGSKYWGVVIYHVNGEPKWENKGVGHNARSFYFVFKTVSECASTWKALCSVLGEDQARADTASVGAFRVMADGSIDFESSLNVRVGQYWQSDGSSSLSDQEQALVKFGVATWMAAGKNKQAVIPDDLDQLLLQGTTSGASYAPPGVPVPTTSSAYSGGRAHGGRRIRTRADQEREAEAEARQANFPGATRLIDMTGTPVEALFFPKTWDATSPFLADLDARDKKELERKLWVLNKDSMADPFAGTTALKNMQQHRYPQEPELDLFLALELQKADPFAAQDAQASLRRYLDSKRRALANPLVLLAVHRAHKDEKVLRCFVQRYPEARRFLSQEEEAVIQSSGRATPPGAAPSSSSATGLKAEWEMLKADHGVSSAAMDELMSMRGMEKVQAKALGIFIDSVHWKAEPDHLKQKSMPLLNFSFEGNPGTGKTTVAKLFAKILHDSGLRAKDTFIELTSQEAKSMGEDKFRQKLDEAKGGVIFIDEAHGIDPVGDRFKGGPIMREILRFADPQNEGKTSSVILAGYEDELREKFFAGDPGLRRRFKDVKFEDFDLPELTEIWTQMMTEKEWTAGNPKLAETAARRVARGRGHKGYGNAGTVRNALDDAISQARRRLGLGSRLRVIEMEDVIGEDPSRNAKLLEVLAKINGMIGWKKVKDAMKVLVERCRTNYQRQLQGHDPEPIQLSRMLLGNPGTGKTTFAQCYAEILKLLGLLQSNEVVYKTAGDFSGSVIGEAKRAAVSICEDAKGKVLIIDEAYNLNDGLYGKDVLDVLVEKMLVGDIVVLLLGYEEQMLEMVRKQNPGLARRIPPEESFFFEDFDGGELLQVLQKTALDKKATLTRDFQEKALKKLLLLKKSSVNFGNAGTVETLFKAALNQARQRDPRSLTVTLLPEDVEMGVADGDPLSLLDGLYRMGEVKEKIDEIRTEFQVAQREGTSQPELGHFVFTGSPGTGKTTVARVMSRIFHDLGLLGRPHTEEVTGQSLKGQYMGQTPAVVKEALDKAIGGVLFIDEAYGLCTGPADMYGREAIDTLVAAMTQEKYKGIVIILAGYTRDIEQMLSANEGFRSRFPADNFFEFPDWTAEDCVSFFRLRAEKENFGLPDQVDDGLRTDFEELRGLPSFANGRDVDKLWKSAKLKRAKRVRDAPEATNTITLSDFAPGAQKMLELRRRAARAGPPPSALQPFTMSFQAQPAQQFAPPPPPQHQSLAPPVHQQEEARSSPDAEEQEDQRGAIRRDPGVSDEDWADLEEAKREEERVEAARQQRLRELEKEARRIREEEERRLQEELERIRRELEEQERREAERRAREAYEARLREEEERRRAHEERIRQEQLRDQQMQQKLQQLRPCPAGYAWSRCSGGWRCGGGSHFVTDQELQSSFMS